MEVPDKQPFPNHPALQEPSRREKPHESDVPMMPPAMFIWIYRIVVGMLLLQGLWGTMLHASAENMMMQGKHKNHTAHHPDSAPKQGQWEGSPEGIAYSEFNHALAGLGVLLVGFGEIRRAMGWQMMAWFRWLLPASLIGSGIFLLIWSDHEAWPIGSWTLVETFSGKDPEMLQHKIFGILALGVGLVEWFLSTGKFKYIFWRALLPGFALIGGLMLFLHMHGLHPTGDHIQNHHKVMGTLALAGGLAWFAGEFFHRSHLIPRTTSHPRAIFKILWALLVVTIGVQLLLYSES